MSSDRTSFGLYFSMHLLSAWFFMCSSSIILVISSHKYMQVTWEWKWLLCYLQIIQVAYVVVADNNSLPLFPTFVHKCCHKPHQSKNTCAGPSDLHQKTNHEGNIICTKSIKVVLFIKCINSYIHLVCAHTPRSYL